METVIIPEWEYRLLNEAADLLSNLVDLQNGSPLVKYEDEWEKVMARSYELLDELDK